MVRRINPEEMPDPMPMGARGVNTSVPTPNVSHDSGSGLAAAAEGLAQTLTTVGAQLEAIEAKKSDTDVRNRVNQLAMEWRQKSSDAGDLDTGANAGYFMQTLKNAIDQRPKAANELQALRDRYLEGLEGPARDKFVNLTNSWVAQQRVAIDSHYAKEARLYREQVLGQQVNEAAFSASMAIGEDPDVYRHALDQLGDTVALEAQERGTPPNSIPLIVTKAKSKQAVKDLQAINDPSKFLKQFNETQDLILEEHITKPLRAQIDSATAYEVERDITLGEFEGEPSLQYNPPISSAVAQQIEEPEPFTDPMAKSKSSAPKPQAKSASKPSRAQQSRIGSELDDEKYSDQGVTEIFGGQRSPKRGDDSFLEKGLSGRIPSNKLYKGTRLSKYTLDIKPKTTSPELAKINPALDLQKFGLHYNTIAYYEGSNKPYFPYNDGQKKGSGTGWFGTYVENLGAAQRLYKRQTRKQRLAYGYTEMEKHMLRKYRAVIRRFPDLKKPENVGVLIAIADLWYNTRIAGGSRHYQPLLNDLKNRRYKSAYRRYFEIARAARGETDPERKRKIRLGLGRRRKALMKLWKLSEKYYGTGQVEQLEDSRPIEIQQQAIEKLTPADEVRAQVERQAELNELKDTLQNTDNLFPHNDGFDDPDLIEISLEEAEHFANENPSLIKGITSKVEGNAESEKAWHKAVTEKYREQVKRNRLQERIGAGLQSKAGQKAVKAIEKKAQGQKVDPQEELLAEQVREVFKAPNDQAAQNEIALHKARQVDAAKLLGLRGINAESVFKKLRPLDKYEHLSDDELRGVIRGIVEKRKQKFSKVKAAAKGLMEQLERGANVELPSTQQLVDLYGTQGLALAYKLEAARQVGAFVDALQNTTPRKREIIRQQLEKQSEQFSENIETPGKAAAEQYQTKAMLDALDRLETRLKDDPVASLREDKQPIGRKLAQLGDDLSLHYGQMNYEIGQVLNKVQRSTGKLYGLSNAEAEGLAKFYIKQFSDNRDLFVAHAINAHKNIKGKNYQAFRNSLKNAGMSSSQLLAFDLGYSREAASFLVSGSTLSISQVKSSYDRDRRSDISTIEDKIKKHFRELHSSFGRVGGDNAYQYYNDLQNAVIKASLQKLHLNPDLDADDIAERAKRVFIDDVYRFIDNDKFKGPILKYNNSNKILDGVVEERAQAIEDYGEAVIQSLVDNDTILGKVFTETSLNEAVFYPNGPDSFKLYTEVRGDLVPVTKVSSKNAKREGVVITVKDALKYKQKLAAKMAEEGGKDSLIEDVGGVTASAAGATANAVGSAAGVAGEVFVEGASAWGDYIGYILNEPRKILSSPETIAQENKKRELLGERPLTAEDIRQMRDRADELDEIYGDAGRFVLRNLGSVGDAINYIFSGGGATDEQKEAVLDELNIKGAEAE